MIDSLGFALYTVQVDILNPCKSKLEYTIFLLGAICLFLISSFAAYLRSVSGFVTIYDTKGQSMMYRYEHSRRGFYPLCPSQLVDMST
jgi:hypothetical protein